MSMEETIYFFKENVKFRLTKQKELKALLKKIAKKEGHKTQTINYIFCNDKYLLNMNKQYLHHNYFTDIITFDNSIEKNIIEGDIFISIDTIKKNAVKFKTTIQNELHRVMIHGLLHLIGYKDKSKKEKEQMRNMEDKYLEIIKF